MPSMLRASPASSSLGPATFPTRAERSPAAMRPAVVCIAAIGSVNRRARMNETIAARNNANAPVPNRYGPARPSGRVSTVCVSTSTGVRVAFAVSGSARNAVPPCTPLCVSPARSASGLRSLVVMSLGSVVTPLTCAHFAPTMPDTPGSMEPSGLIDTRLPPEIARVEPMRRHASRANPSSAGADQRAQLTADGLDLGADRRGLGAQVANRGVGRRLLREAGSAQRRDHEHADRDGEHRHEQPGAQAAGGAGHDSRGGRPDSSR